MNRPRLFIAAAVIVAWGADQGGAVEPRDLSVQQFELHQTLSPSGIPARELNLPPIPDNYSQIDWPPHFRDHVDRMDNTPADNPITDAGATLGRVLFYDVTLSQNGTTSCASCHHQSFAFTDDKKLSVGFDGQAVDRNSMSLVNARFYQRGRFFWDERAKTLEEQVTMPIENELEMGHDLDELVLQLQLDPIYPPLFRDAFGDSAISKTSLSRALAQFIRSIVSYRSRYDEGHALVSDVLDRFPNFSDEENLGKATFFGRANCASCHMGNGLPFNPNRDATYDSSLRVPRQTAFFMMTVPAVNGIDSDVEGVDQGIGRVTLAKMDRGRFKSPSLRNLEVTGPYMHDGRFHTIDQVIEHYNWSVRPHPNLDSRLSKVAANGMGIPEKQKVALEKFLLTLTDHELLKDPKFSDPFVR